MRKSAGLAALLVSSMASAGGSEVVLLQQRTHFAAPVHVVQGPPSQGVHNGRVSIVQASPRQVLEGVLPRATQFQLVERAHERFDHGSVTHFGVMHEGVPVLGAGAVLRVDDNGKPTVAVDALPTSLPDVHPALSAAQAETIARTKALANMSPPVRALGMPKTQGELVIRVQHGEGTLVWRFLPSYPLATAFQPSILIDAQTGEVLAVENRVRFLNQVRSYKNNPVTNPTTELLPLPFSLEGNKLQTPFLKGGNCIDRKRVIETDFGFGPTPIHVCDIEQTAVANQEGDFDYEPKDGTNEAAEDPFAEATMFYHAARAQAFFRTLQGDAEAQVVNAKPLQTIANLRSPPGLFRGDLNRAKDPDAPLDPFTNAFFSPGGGIESLLGITGGAIVFGQGERRDFAYDGDVIYHEFTHAVVDKTLNLGGYTFDSQGASAAPGAMNEGLADYFSSALTGDPNVGEYAAAEISQNEGVIRTLANQDVCPKTLVGEVHADSTFFSAALWEARASLPEASRATFDASLYKAMRTAPESQMATYEEIAALFVAVMQTDFPDGAAALSKALAARNILPACKRVLSAQDGPVKAPSYGGSLNAWAAFSRQDLGGVSLAPGLLQFTRTFPEGTAQFRVRVSLEASGQNFGGNGKFDPVILVHYGSPITWKASGSRLTNDADEQRSVTAGDIDEAFDIPEGATEVYVQIANKGQAAGNYQEMELYVASTKSPAVDAGAPPTGATGPLITSVGGCNQTSSERNAGSAATLGLGLAALALLKRRK